MIEQINKKLDFIENRFKGAKFVVSCFDTIEEVDTKILNDTDETIIFSDLYEKTYMESKKKKWITEKVWKDYFILSRKPNEKVIYWKDVIDEMIKNDFIRNDCDQKFLENIGLITEKRNKNLIPCYGFGWGS